MRSTSIHLLFVDLFNIMQHPSDRLVALATIVLGVDVDAYLEHAEVGVCLLSSACMQVLGRCLGRASVSPVPF